MLLNIRFNMEYSTIKIFNFFSIGVNQEMYIKYINRDINSVKNIKKMVISYIENQFLL